MSKTPTRRTLKNGTISSTKSSDITPIKRKRVVKPKNTSNNKGQSEIEDIEDLLKFKEEEIAEIRVSLLEWYDKNKRDLPWRRLKDDDDGKEKKAYGVWVSEVMLQQTRVATVIDYFNRWVLKWPSLYHLSLASLEEVNEMWAGLGYYRRARYLLEGAKKIIEDGGNFPRTVSSLKKVPGIGEYTAGAIASIAFNEVVPVVDGNVVRVLARLKAISANPKDSVTVKKFWSLAGQLVDPHRPGEFNQALMELGATICTPTSPSCSECPISAQCHALALSRQGGIVTDYPLKVVKAKQRNEFSAVCVLEVTESHNLLENNQKSRHCLLVKRPDGGLLAGLWEFPSVLLGQESETAIRRKAIDKYLKTSFNLDAKKTCKVLLREEVGEYVHIFSHIRLKMYVEYLVIHLNGGLKLLQSVSDEGNMIWKCADSKELSSMGLTSGVRKVYTMVQQFKENSLTAATQDTKQTKSRKRR
ncbi:adenine DNA glycosylase-like [Chenopodium quinoa]|uniref:adenine DNA glycosylase-like n=1 Tax=Chenopodium quinoa TaxID=63459 RepID=UPI000B77D577|nr:adenine DNA glycosylase-like [Chenopodium quinoa]